MDYFFIIVNRDKALEKKWWYWSKLPMYQYFRLATQATPVLVTFSMHILKIIPFLNEMKKTA